MISCIYEGAVRHRRFEVRRHEFRYRLALAYLDLDELASLLGGRLASRRPGLVRFRRRDYLGDPAVGLADATRDAVAAAAGRRPAGPVRLLTQLRSWGHCFNPVSFYYCFDEDDESLEHVLAEVTNTPWGERRAYVLSATDGCSGGPLVGKSAKELHVSPFMAMDYTYEWRVTVPSDRLEVQIQSVREGQRAFDATLCLRRHELSAARVRRIGLRYPFANLRVLALIYGHAAALKLKGVPVHGHPRAGVA